MNDATSKVLKSLNAYLDQFLQLIPNIVLAVFVIALGVMFARWIARLFASKVVRKSHDPLIGGFIAGILRMGVIIFAILFALHILGLSGVAGALFATAGASAIVLGFAFKDIIVNFLAGIILAFNRPFSVNDTLEIGDVFGEVKAMRFRYTHIKTFDGKDVYIPNSDVLTKPVINYTADNFLRADFIVGIAYENDIEGAKKIIMDCLRDNPEVIHDEEHFNFVVEHELAPSTVDLKVFFWIGTMDYRRGALETKGRLIQEIKTRLEANGYSLPADIREIKFYDASAPFQINTGGSKQ